MPDTKNKSEVVERGIVKIVSQMPKEVAKRKWSKAAYAALITYIVEASGAAWKTKEARDAFRAAMLDSDLSFSSNTKKYLVKRGFLPEGDEYEAESFE